LSFGRWQKEPFGDSFAISREWTMSCRDLESPKRRKTPKSSRVCEQEAAVLESDLTHHEPWNGQVPGLREVDSSFLSRCFLSLSLPPISMLLLG
jgi:hypothetical protein